MEWQRAFVFALEARVVGHEDHVETQAGVPITLHVVLEGEHKGLPIYCTDTDKLRVDGRAVPRRMVLTPAHAELAGREIQWTAIQPSADGMHWRQTRLPGNSGQWSFELVDFPGGTSHGIRADEGTMRFAAAVEASSDPAKPRMVATPGWSETRGPVSPDGAPGFRVTRYSNRSIEGYARAHARIPVIENATPAHARSYVALRPVDLVLSSYQSLAEHDFPSTPDGRPEDESWSWLFESVYEAISRRSLPGLALVGPGSRGIRFVTPEHAIGRKVARGDVLIGDGRYAILEADDGDNWLGGGDSVLHVLKGDVRAGRLDDLPGKTIRVLRFRDFAELRALLNDAGYGPLGAGRLLDAKLARAIESFQRDRSIPITGLPDDRTRAALAEFLERMDSPEE